jgi:hypothetical protein
MMRTHENDGLPVLIRLFLDIALHRKGPQDVPAAGVVLVLALSAYLAAGAAVLWPTAADGSSILGKLAVDLAVMVLVIVGLLAAVGRASRAMQTLTALFGTGALLSLASLPFVWIASRSIVEGEPVPGAEFPALASASLLFVLLLASLLVTGHILRHALNWSYAAGVLAAVGYFAASVAAFQRFFPGE